MVLDKKDWRKFDQKFQEIHKIMDRRFEQVDKRFNDVFTVLDRQTVILQRLDQERIFTFNFIKRIEKQVKRNAQAIKLIKAKLKI